MRIERLGHEHLEGWAQLRAQLWPDNTVAEHRKAIADYRAKENTIAFAACDAAGVIFGFAEASLRYDYVNGCETSPVLFLEGIFVREEHRRRGLAKALCRAVATWGCKAGCSEFASDALLGNLQSHAFHAALGFEETERVVYFRKPL